MHLVFVYGTLRRHEANAHLLAGAEKMAEQAWVFGTLYDTGHGYPALVLAGPESHRRTKVFGELYRVTLQQLAALDELEGYREGEEDNLYDRVTETVYTDKGTYDAYVYVFPAHRAAGLQPILWGDWKCHRRLPHPTELEEMGLGAGEEEAAAWHYFAYGSCMDSERFEADGVADLFQDVVGRGVLKGYDLAFTHRSLKDGEGRADLLETGGAVEGKVYRVGRAALAYLYRREGVAGNIYRPAFVDIEVDGNVLSDVLTFVVVNKTENTPPPDDYAVEILRGAQSVVSPEYYRQLVEKIGRLKGWFQ